MAGFFATDYFIRHAEMLRSTMSNEEIVQQMNLLYLPEAPAVSSKLRADRASTSSSSSSSSSRGIDRITDAEEDFLCGLGINAMKSQHCALCAMSKPRSAFLSTKNCVHEFCTACLTTHAAATLTHTRTAQIECPHPCCGRHFDIDQCRGLLSEASFQVFNLSLQEAATPASQRVYCPFPECSAFIPILRPDGSPDCTCVECHSCGREICLECNAPWEKECDICADVVSHTDFISTKDCVHEYCAVCCRKYAEVQILSGSAQVDCPHPNCAHAFHISQCATLLSAPNFDILTTRLTEAAIPAAHKVFCPFQDCSILMERSEEDGGRGPFAVCFACHRGFCMECKVPWHGSVGSCAEYRAQAENAKQGGDQKLRKLAKENKWQACPDCVAVVELKSGCYHITCRCGTEFCYLCQKKWVNKKSTCKCKLWDERNIIGRR